MPGRRHHQNRQGDRRPITEGPIRPAVNPDFLGGITNSATLPALPTYVSAYGGSGIVTVAIIQSRSQMARTWGLDAAKAIWDSCTITGILGGVTDAENLRDFAAIACERDETSWQASPAETVRH